jgi:thymidylate synthase ThyX
MEFIEQKVTKYVECDPAIKIEKCGRICYKSEMGSSSDFILKRMTTGHDSIFEHYWVEVFCESDYFVKVMSQAMAIGDFHRAIKFFDFKDYAIRGNIRTWRELMLNENMSPRGRKLVNQLILSIVWDIPNATLFFKADDTAVPFSAFTLKGYTTVHIVTDRGISHELVRHREMSFSQESTRYCNYGDGVTFISTCNDYHSVEQNKVVDHACGSSEAAYNFLLSTGAKPQIARDVLPMNLKTELYMTGLNSKWDEFFYKRCCAAAHPRMRALAEEISKIVHGE